MKINQVDNWGVYCDTLDGYNAMTVQIGFSHRFALFDETEFCIESWNAHELDELFSDFCRENGFEDVDVQYVSIIRAAANVDELTRMEESIC